ncbi:unnamed protein product [Adineta steineri]|uniref:Uncharacterized protein n=1 Tax=Adineta steineri TaxID=433720 RepID=A0A819HVQ4_9BILA|nr:unnamed protein product [Adineta steineri]
MASSSSLNNDDARIPVDETSHLNTQPQQNFQTIIRSGPRHSISWGFPGRWGTVIKIDLAEYSGETVTSSIPLNDANAVPESTSPAIPLRRRVRNLVRPTPETDDSHKLLGEWRATAIAGNDISSSCLYTAGICSQKAGQYSFISLYLVALVLYLYRNIYSEVGLALPLNGGAYNVLLNCTSKFIASIAACLTLVSYIATAVVSASSAIAYGQNLWSGLDPAWAVMALLGFFCLLTLFGLKESANVALVIFIIHICTMSLLVIMCLYKIMLSHDSITMFVKNWQTESLQNVPIDIYYGFGLALLGVSGFETSSNYIEEQGAGVFPKTLRNMWYVVSLFNPLFSLLSLFIMPMSEIRQHRDDLLAAMGTVTSQPPSSTWLNTLISADALLVLSGAVLTSYVGITGLIRRMSYDRCLPMFLSYTNRWRHTNHFIIIGFFVVTSLLHYIVRGNLESLAGVYSISFLSVMSLFAIGNMILKYKRGTLRRSIYASWPHVIIGFILVLVGLIAVIILNLPHITYFILYFGITFLIVMLMFSRNRVLKLLIYFGGPQKWLDMLNKHYKKIEDRPMLFFTRTDDPSVINKAILYVRENELTNFLKICHIYEHEIDIPPMLEANIKFLDKQYPKLCLDLVLVKGRFDPPTVKKLSEQLDIPRNFMFITCPAGNFSHHLAEMGGIRLITHS